MFNSSAVTACIFAGASVLTGCASIVNGSSQVISVDARHKGQALAGASCQLNNGKGVFYVTTPGTITVHRAYDDMNIRCDKEGYASGMSTVKSNTKPMAFGNILFGGPIGVAVDAGTGAAYDYPSIITVVMDELSTPAAPRAIAPSASLTGAPSHQLSTY